MNVLLNRQRHRRDGSAKSFRNFRKFPSRGVAGSRVFRVLEFFACSCMLLACLSVVEIRDYSKSHKEMAFVAREGYLQEELLAELIAPGFLN